MAEAEKEIVGEVIPTKVEELDQDYLRFVDMRVYKEEEILADEFDDDGNQKVLGVKTVLDVAATHEKIVAAKARAEARRAKKAGRVVAQHVGFNRADRRRFMKSLSKPDRSQMIRQAREAAAKEKV